MQIKTISIQEYRNYLDTLDAVIFQQSDFQAQKFMHDGWQVEFIQASEQGNVYASIHVA